MRRFFGVIALWVMGMALLGFLCGSGDSPSRPTETPMPSLTWDEWREKAVEISYDDLFRYAENHEGKIIFYRGKVVQVMEKRGDFQLRVSVTKGDYGWDDNVLLRYDDAPVRILDNDIITFVGRMNGTVTYEAVLGNDITIPDITALSVIVKDENDKDSPSFDW